MQFNLNDGGREAAGYKGAACDCVVRAVAIADGLPYKEALNLLRDANIRASNGRGLIARKLRASTSRLNPTAGVFPTVYDAFLKSRGWAWTPTMQIGSGCNVHLTPDELPAKGVHIVRVSHHLTTIVDGVINDTYDPSREGTRCVYGYYSKIV